MNITLFKEVTTEQALIDIAKESEDYQGLYVDMKDPKQRKYVKEKAVAIKDMIKQVNRVRIDLPKVYRANVESQAAQVIASLESSNEPFTLLIDDYDAERKLVLDAEKERKAKEEAAIQKECDHEYAILLDKSYLADKLAAEKAQDEHDEAIRVDAAAKAEEVLKSKIAYDAEVKSRNDAARVADKNNVRTINRAIFTAFTHAGLGVYEAQVATQSLIDSKIPHTTINY